MKGRELDRRAVVEATGKRVVLEAADTALRVVITGHVESLFGDYLALKDMFCHESDHPSINLGPLDDICWFMPHWRVYLLEDE